MCRLVSLLGMLGIVLCVAGILGLWYVELRIDRACERVFRRVDESLAAIDGRLSEAQALAVKSRITIEEIQQRARDWTKDGAGERLSEKFEIEAKVTQLLTGLQRSVVLLERSQEAGQHVRQVLEIGDQLGLSLQATAVDPLLLRIAEIKDDLRRAIEIVESFDQAIGDGRNEEVDGKRVEQVRTVVSRLLATFGKVDSRLASFRERMANTRRTIGQAGMATHIRVVAAVSCVTLFLLWMAAGQLCLWRWARGNHSN